MNPMTPEEQGMLVANVGLIWKAVHALPPAVFRHLTPEDMAHALIPEFVRALRQYDPARGPLSNWVVAKLRRRAASLLASRRFIDGPNDGLTENKRLRLAVSQLRRVEGCRPCRRVALHTPPDEAALAALDAALDELPEGDMELVAQLHGLRGRAKTTLREEAESRRCSRQNVHARVVKIRGKIKNIMGTMGMDA